MNKKLLLCLMFLGSISVFSQKEANFWYFGNQSGLDFNVLSTLDFSETKPTMICIEENNYNTQKILETNTHKYLQNNGYFLTSKIGVSLIYIDQTYESKMNEIMSL